MTRLLSIFAITSILALMPLMSACTQTPAGPPIETAEFYVPTTLMVQTPGPGPSPLASQVLAGSNFEDFFVPRSEKFVYGSIALEEISAYSVLQYDVQRISSRRDGGYRYAWAVREGVFVP